jgi:hypothetical protein
MALLANVSRVPQLHTADTDSVATWLATTAHVDGYGDQVTKNAPKPKKTPKKGKGIEE